MNQESKASMKFYYKDGTSSDEYHYSKQLHRIDGPAIERSDGSRTWLIDGLYYTEEDFNKLMEEVEKLSPVLRLIDPREWVRKL